MIFWLHINDDIIINSDSDNNNINKKIIKLNWIIEQFDVSQCKLHKIGYKQNISIISTCFKSALVL